MNEDIEKIIDEIKRLNILDMYANFACFAEDMFTYDLTHENLHHEFSIISDSWGWKRNWMLKEMPVKDLLSTENMRFFQHSMWLLDENGEKSELTTRYTRLPPSDKIKVEIISIPEADE